MRDAAARLPTPMLAKGLSMRMRSQFSTSGSSRSVGDDDLEQTGGGEGGGGVALHAVSSPNPMYAPRPDELACEDRGIQMKTMRSDRGGV